MVRVFPKNSTQKVRPDHRFSRTHWLCGNPQLFFQYPKSDLYLSFSRHSPWSSSCNLTPTFELESLDVRLNLGLGLTFWDNIFVKNCFSRRLPSFSYCNLTKYTLKNQVDTDSYRSTMDVDKVFGILHFS